MQLVFQQNGKILTSSRLIAEKFGKNHFDILRSIKKMDSPQDFNESNFALVDYVDGKGEKRPEYAITKDGFTFLVMGFTGKQAAQFKVEYINEFNKMEESLKNPVATLTKYDLARMLLEAGEENKQLVIENEAMKPKALFADTVSTSSDCILIRELAKYLQNRGVKIGEKRLFEWMRENKYLISFGADYNTPTQKSMQLGLFQLKKTSIPHSNGTITISVTPKVTGKGQVYFINKFMQGYNNQLIA